MLVDVGSGCYLSILPDTSPGCFWVILIPPTTAAGDGKTCQPTLLLVLHLYNEDLGTNGEDWKFSLLVNNIHHTESKCDMCHSLVKTMDALAELK